MTKREKIVNAKLEQMEKEFSSLLVPVLQECSRGRWGLFGQNEHLARYYQWNEADRLKELAKQIIEIRSSYGESNPDCERLIYYCGLRGSNDQGEPRLADRFLKELTT